MRRSWRLSITATMTSRWRERALRVLGICLIAIALCAVASALLLGPFEIHSLDDALAAHLLERAALAVGGVVLGILGWVLRGSGNYN